MRDTRNLLSVVLSNPMSRLRLGKILAQNLVLIFLPSTYSLWAYLAAYVIVHWPIYRSYTGMDRRLSDFADAYVNTMRGIVTRGNVNDYSHNITLLQ